MPVVYMVRCADGTFYTGWAADVQARIDAHNRGRGAKYTAGRRPVTLVYSEVCETRAAALQREHVLKRLTRAQKLRLAGETNVNPEPGTRNPEPETPELS